MGTFRWPMRIAGIDGRQTRDLEAIVDTGAIYTTLPAHLLHGLGVTPTGERRFLVADGRRVQMEYGEARVTIDGEDVTTLVVFGRDGTPPCWAPTPWRDWVWRWTRWNSDWSPPI